MNPANSSIRRQRTRRQFLRTAGTAAAAFLCSRGFVHAAEGTEKVTYENQARGVRILPGQWRPHYPWEHIAWVSPMWPSQDYIWLDFPEAIFSSQGLLFLSHINPPFPTVFSDLPQVPWSPVEGGIAFERPLPNGIVFGGSVVHRSDPVVDLELRIMNGSKEPLNHITLQTCAYLRGIAEFGDHTQENKFVHTADRGWIGLDEAMKMEDADARYRAGWRTSGKRVLDAPFIAVVSNKADRLFALTWGRDTLSMVGNPNHPCAHADPRFPNLAPGESATIRGKIIFFEGSLDDFAYDDFV